MNKKEIIAQELAESFVNGNISYVRKKIGNSAEWFNAVLKALEKMGNPYDSVESFRRLIGN